MYPLSERARSAYQLPRIRPGERTLDEQLVENVRAAEIVHLDETPWYQARRPAVAWVATSAATTVYRIDSRRKEELSALIG
jgi:phage-related protein